MAENSKIEWTHHTVNPWWGCTEVHAGCDNCYARVLAHRYGKDVWGNDKPRQEIKTWREDLVRYQKKAQEKGEIHRVFPGSMMDIFERSMPMLNYHGHDAGMKTGDHRTELFEKYVPYTPNLLYLFLTKRFSNINRMVPEPWLENPPKNVMFGATVVDDETAFFAYRDFQKVKGRKFISLEPQLADVYMERLLNTAKQTGLEWIIQGGESGPHRRPFDVEWAIRLKIRCQKYGVKYFFKQIDKVQPIPEDLMIREVPV